jgi:hypothetical protein
MEYGMNLRKCVSLAIVITILSTTLIYGDSETDKIFDKLDKGLEESHNAQRKALDDYEHTQDLALTIKILLFIGFVVFAIIYIPRAQKKRAKALETTIRDITRNELDSKISSAPKLKTCENCGIVIGRLENSYTFEGHLVCGECHQRLKNQE